METFQTNKIDDVGTELKSPDFLDFLTKVKELSELIDKNNRTYFHFNDSEELSVKASKYGTQFDIYISINEIKEIFNNSEENNPFILVRKLILHEMLHIKLGHLSYEYSKVDPQILNLAGDIVINNLLDIRYPGVRANNFDYEEGLTTWNYIKLLERDLNNNLNKEKIMDLLADSKEKLISQTYDIYVNRLENLKELKSLNSQNLFQTEKPEILKYSEYKKNSIQGFEDFKNILLKSEGLMRISPASKKSTFFKLNRRHDGDILMPGKEYRKNGYSNKFQDTAVLFCDVSGSMNDYIKEFAYTISELERQTGIMVVTYNSNFIGEVDPQNNFYKASGGTNFNRSLKEFELLSNKKLTRFYVFTDGHDETLKIALKEYSEMRVFLYSNRRIEETTEEL